jgi:hypothetical protein
MLMYSNSLVLQLPACVTIYNQCLNTELISPIYFGNGAICPKLSGRQIDISIAMNASFEMNAAQDEFEGALLFRLQSYFNWYNMDALTTEANENETTHVYMLVAWKVTDAKHFIYVVLVEHTKEFTWNESELKKLYYENLGRFNEYNGPISDTWLVNDNMTLKMTFNVRGLKEDFELSVFISEEEKDDYAMKPLCIDLER